jgi:hypothetical protein
MMKENLTEKQKTYLRLPTTDLLARRIKSVMMKKVPKVSTVSQRAQMYQGGVSDKNDFGLF